MKNFIPTKSIRDGVKRIGPINTHLGTMYKTVTEKE